MISNVQGVPRSFLSVLAGDNQWASVVTKLPVSMLHLLEFGLAEISGFRTRIREVIFVVVADVKGRTA
jgi:hypothetical protein